MTKDPVLYLLQMASYHLTCAERGMSWWVPKGTPVVGNHGVAVFDSPGQQYRSVMHSAEMANKSKKQAKSLTEAAELLQDVGF